MLPEGTCLVCEDHDDCKHIGPSNLTKSCANDRCNICPINCRFCDRDNYCVLCDEGYDIFEGECGLNCPPGWGEISDGNCGDVCGDGVRREALPVCDDGNSVAGDGCSDTCQVEDGWICSGGDKYNKDTCKLVPLLSTISQGLNNKKLLKLTFNKEMDFDLSKDDEILQFKLEGFTRGTDFTVKYMKLSQKEYEVTITNTKRIREPMLKLTFDQGL